MNRDDRRSGKNRFASAFTAGSPTVSAGKAAAFPSPVVAYAHRARVWLAPWLAFVLLTARAPAGEAPPAAELRTLDGLVGHWMALRTTLAQEKREWNEHRQQWEQEIALLEKEAETLRKEREDVDSFASSFEAERTVALARKERTEAELRKLRPVLDRAEADLRRWRERIPAGLRPPLATGFAALPATQKEADKLALARRAQTVAALYAQIETLQNAFQSASETLDVEDGRRQVDVLYVGLARAFAVSAGNDWAAVGVPSDSGWAWTPAPGEAEAVRRAIDMVNRKASAQLVILPLQVIAKVQP